MNVISNQQYTQERINNLMNCALILIGTSVAAALVSQSFGVFLAMFSLGVLVGNIAVFWRLVAVVQLRVLELIVLVAVVGNGIGFLWMKIASRFKHYDSDQVISLLFFALIIATLLFLLMSGVTNALMHAASKHIESQAERFYYMFLYTLYPFAWIGVVVCAIAIFVEAATYLSIIYAAATIVFGLILSSVHDIRRS